jgi:hypothetical protein
MTEKGGVDPGLADGLMLTAYSHLSIGALQHHGVKWVLMSDAIGRQVVRSYTCTPVIH